MINFINFITLIVWAVIKLLGSLIIAFIAAAICHGMAVAVGVMYYKTYKDRYSVWDEIRVMESEVYGDETTGTDKTADCR